MRAPFRPSRVHAALLALLMTPAGALLPAPTASPLARAAGLGVQPGQTWRIRWTISEKDTVIVRTPPLTSGHDTLQFFEWSAAQKKANAVQFRGRPGSVFFTVSLDSTVREIGYGVNTLEFTFVPFDRSRPFTCKVRVLEKIRVGHSLTGLTSENPAAQVETAILEVEPGRLKTCLVTRVK